MEKYWEIIYLKFKINKKPEGWTIATILLLIPLNTGTKVQAKFGGDTSPLTPTSDAWWVSVYPKCPLGTERLIYISQKMMIIIDVNINHQ